MAEVPAQRPDPPAPEAPEPKRPRTTVGGLYVCQLIEDQYSGLDGQDFEERNPSNATRLCAVEAIELTKDFDDLVPERVVYDSRTGQVLDRDLVMAGRRKEMDQMQQHGVYEEVSPEEARGRRASCKWLDGLREKDGVRFVRSRLVATEVNTYGRDDVAANTPPVAVVRLVLSMAASKPGRFVGLHDAEVAFFHAFIDEWIVVIPPRGVRKDGKLWQLLKALYGIRRANQLWQEFLAKLFLDHDWFRVAVSAGA